MRAEFDRAFSIDDEFMDHAADYLEEMAREAKTDPTIPQLFIQSINHDLKQKGQAPLDPVFCTGGQVFLDELQDDGTTMTIPLVTLQMRGPAAETMIAMEKGDETGGWLFEKLGAYTRHLEPRVQMKRRQTVLLDRRMPGAGSAKPI